MGWPELEGHKSILIPMACRMTSRSRPLCQALLFSGIPGEGLFRVERRTFSLQRLFMLALPPDTQCCPVPNNLEANKHFGVEEHGNHTVYCSTHQVLSKPLLISTCKM